MSVTLKSISLAQKPKATSGVPHIYEEGLVAVLEIVKSDVKLKVEAHIEAGFKTDGASIPKIFQWFLPSWDESGARDSGVTHGDIYNIGSTIHDGLYIHKGFGLFTREEVDDILRGIWRESGISRFKAGMADKAVEWFAGGSKHWGSDSYGVGDLFTVDF